MASDITYDHSETAPGIDAGTGNVPEGPQNPAQSGVDPTIAGSVESENSATGEELDKARGDGDKTKDASEKLDENEKENKDRFGKTDTNLSADPSGAHGKDGAGSALGGPGSGKGPLDSAMPSNQAGGPPSMPPMGGGSPGGGSGGGMPSLPMMNQHDMNNAPNRDKLIEQLKGMDPEHGGSLGQLSDDPDGRKAQELAEKLVNHQPPIPYAWGGGHGGTPGPSQGTRDGGYADQCGDYAKTGVDCSGLARWMSHTLYGVDIGGTSESQYASGRPVDAAHARPGDIFFPNSAGRPPHHVQVYVGNNQVIEAQKSGTYLKFSPLQSGEFRRFAG